MVKDVIHAQPPSFVTSERTERSSYKQSYIYIGHLHDIQAALKPFKKMGKNVNKVL